MKPERNKLIIQTDYSTTTKFIIGQLFFILFLFLVILYCISGVFNWGNMSSSTDMPGIVILLLFTAPMFILSLLGIPQIQNALMARKALSILYTLTEDGYTDHSTNKQYVWADFIKIYNFSNDYKGGRRCLILNVKHTRGIAKLESKYITREVYRLMALHVLKYAPKSLTNDIIVPVITDTSFYMASRSTILSAIAFIVALGFLLFQFRYLGFVSPKDTLIVFLLSAFLAIYPLYYFKKKN